MTHNVRLRQLSPPGIEIYRPRFVDLYREVYAGPPYDEGEEHVAAYRAAQSSPSSNSPYENPTGDRAPVQR